MFLFLISQGENKGYDTYDSAVVAASDEGDAKTIHPQGDDVFVDPDGNFYEWWGDNKEKTHGWCNNIEAVKVECIGVAGDKVERGLILASFNAG